MADFKSIIDLDSLENLAFDSPEQLSGVAILGQVDPEISGDNNKQPRPSDVRLLLRTADLKGETCEFPNFGHPDNELSKVPFDGENAIVVMPAGDTPRAQLTSAIQIVHRLKKSKLDRVTPDFVQNEIVNKGSLCHKFAAQAYGPAPFAKQAERFVANSLPASNGPNEIFEPVIEDGYAYGMRAPTTEEAYMVVYSGKFENLFVRGGTDAAALLSKIEEAAPVKVKGSNTAHELFDGFSRMTKGIVLARDSATGNVKPIRLQSARDIFDLSRLPVVVIDDKGTVTQQFRPVGLKPL